MSSIETLIKTCEMANRGSNVLPLKESDFFELNKMWMSGLNGLIVPERIPGVLGRTYARLLMDDRAPRAWIEQAIGQAVIAGI